LFLAVLGSSDQYGLVLSPPAQELLFERGRFRCAAELLVRLEQVQDRVDCIRVKPSTELEGLCRRIKLHPLR
jgi:hypothetical protein